MKLSWHQFEKLVKKLHEKLEKEKFDAIVCISTGGLVLGKMLSEMLQLPLAIVAIKSYKARKKRKPKFSKHVLTTQKISGNVLLVDDVSHTGDTLETACMLLKKSEIRKIKTAVLFIKPRSKFIPDYFLKKTKKWIVFPYESNR